MMMVINDFKLQMFAKCPRLPFLFFLFCFVLGRNLNVLIFFSSLISLWRWEWRNIRYIVHTPLRERSHIQLGYLRQNPPSWGTLCAGPRAYSSQPTYLFIIHKIEKDKVIDIYIFDPSIDRSRSISSFRFVLFICVLLITIFTEIFTRLFFFCRRLRMTTTTTITMMKRKIDEEFCEVYNEDHFSKVKMANDITHTSIPLPLPFSFNFSASSFSMHM